MKKTDLVKIEVKNKRSLGKLGKVVVYLTPEIKKKLEKETTKNGETLLSLFEQGRALRGFKHLVERIRQNNPKEKIIFTEAKTDRGDGEIKINYEDYKKTAGQKFFSFYRETGLDAASFYLNKYFPDDFEYDNTRLSESQVKTLDRNFKQVINQVPKKRKNNKIIIDETKSIISDLSKKKRLIKQEIQELEELRDKSNLFFFKTRIDEFESRLTKNYAETRGKNSWQKWIHSNNWMFGVNYQPPIEKQKINIAGSMPDYAFPTMDGFLDILEIKLPGKEIIVKDTSHSGAYAWSGDANKAIGQVVTYLNDIELYQLHLREEIKNVYGIDLFLIKPRAFILIGNKDNWKEEQHKALRKLNYSLHGIEVLSYTDLLQRAKQIVKNYTQKL